MLPHVTLARLQRAEGSWRLDGPLAAAVGVELEVMRAVAASLPGGPGAGAMVATAAALRFLRARCGRWRPEWTLLAAKAAAWLDGALEAAGTGLTADELAARLEAAGG